MRTIFKRKKREKEESKMVVIDVEIDKIEVFCKKC